MDVRGQIRRNRIRQRDFAAIGGVREQQRREDFRDGANLEDGIAVEWGSSILDGSTVADDSTSGGLENTHHDADSLAIGIDAFDEDLPNFSVGWNTGLC
jgi:hypothetical protein